MSWLGRGERILHRKPIERIEETEVGEGTRLNCSSGPWRLTAIGVGGIIGAGTGGLEVSPRQRSTLAGTVAKQGSCRSPGQPN